MTANPTYLIVDGHNVMHAWPELAKHLRTASKRHLARTTLLQRLRHLQDMTGMQIVVIFDGTTAKITEERETGGLQIIYADAGHTADDLIEKLAAKYARERSIRVASADGLVRETVAAFGADWLSPEMLKSLCDDAEQDMRGRIDQLKTRRHLLAWLSLSGASLALPAWGSKPPPPGLDSAAVEAASRYCRERKTHALLIRQHGKTLHESQASKSPHRIFSGTKAFWGLAALAAVEDGLFKWDEKVADTLPDWKKDSRRAAITVQHLLDFTAGIERGLLIHEDGLKDRNRIALQRPVIATPGKRFIYGPSQLQVFHQLLKIRLGKTSPTRYLERRVLRPLGLGPQRYLPDAAGNPLLAAGFMMTARQWARLGDCLLKQVAPILKPESFRHFSQGSDVNPAYSCGFWNNHTAGKTAAREVDVEAQLELDWDRQSWSRACLSKSAPPDLIACIGSSGQRLYAIPSQQLVIIRQGADAGFSDTAFLRTLLA